VAAPEPLAVTITRPTVTTRIESPRRRAIRRFLRHRLALIGLVAILAIIVLAIVGSEQAAMEQHTEIANQPPGTITWTTKEFVKDMTTCTDPNDLTTCKGKRDADGKLVREEIEHTQTFLLGTDGLGRDVLSRVLVGGRVSLIVAFASVLLSTLIGVLVGVLSGYLGGRTDATLMRIVDVALSFPVILLLLVVSTLIGPGLSTLILMIGAVTWARGARIVRGQVLALRSATFIEAAKVIGVSDRRMIVTHVLPNIIAPIVVLATFGVATVVIFEAGLSYLGLGIQPPTPSWGNLVNGARTITVLERYAWQWVPAALAIVAMVLAVNFVGDGLRDAFDQRSTTDR
jgi:peptide/nickel transport system permease protein